jgi:hypothetical protein
MHLATTKYQTLGFYSNPKIQGLKAKSNISWSQNRLLADCRSSQKWKQIIVVICEYVNTSSCNGKIVAFRANFWCWGFETFPELKNLGPHLFASNAFNIIKICAAHPKFRSVKITMAWPCMRFIFVFAY